VAFIFHANIADVLVEYLSQSRRFSLLSAAGLCFLAQTGTRPDKPRLFLSKPDVWSLFEDALNRVCCDSSNPCYL